MVPREMLGLAAEFAVASELCRRGLYAQLTLGNKKRTDILVHDDETDNFLRIEVKAKQGLYWPNCKGIYGSHVMLVFADYADKTIEERPDFFIVTVEDWKQLVTNVIKSHKDKRVFMNERNVPIWPTELKNGKPYEGIGVSITMIKELRVISKPQEGWEKITTAIGSGQAVPPAPWGYLRATSGTDDPPPHGGKFVRRR